MEKEKSFAASKMADYIRDFTAIGNPFLLLLMGGTVCGLLNNPRAFVILVIGFLIQDGLGSMIKLFYHKQRPDQQEFSGSIEKIDAGSFPSIHSSRISFVYGFLIFLVPVLILKITFGVVILVVGYSRVFLKKHFFVDVMAGFIIGSALAYGATYLL